MAVGCLRRYIMSVTERDNFSSDTIRKLGERVGLLCSKPDCRAPTKGPHTDSTKAISVGKASHIHAAAPGGKRYDESQSEEERRSIDNGIWLCSTCATLIDTDADRFPVHTLRSWKVKAELEALENIGKPVGGSAEAVMAAMEGRLRKLLVEGGVTPLSDADAGHVLERIASFPSHHRLTFPTGQVMGLPAELASRLNQAEYREIASAVVKPTMTIIQTVMSACSRLAFVAVRDFQAACPSNADVATVVVKTLTTSMLAQLTGIVFGGLNLQPGMAAYANLTLAQRLEHHVAEVWESYQACLTGYDPETHAPGSDEQARHQLAVHALGGRTDRAIFERELASAVQARAAEIEDTFTSFMALLPKSMVVITDTASIFEADHLMRRYGDTVARLTALRGSPILPE